ncbi:MAG: cyclic nucleotide-binding domain-containing protein [Blastochloris sp.]|nr:cyclic nucleotide-binding domain-containing protein [Blastochloris sp.]
MSDLAQLQAFSHLPKKDFTKGEDLIQEGQQVNTLIILIEGAVEVLKGDLRVATSRRPGAVFGEISVLLNIPHTATVRAIQPCKVYLLENPLEFLRQHPEAALHVSQLLARRLDALTRYLVDVKAQFKEQQGHIGMVDEVLESLLNYQPR